MNRRILLFWIFIVFVSHSAWGQIYSIPFASKGNRIELDVVNVGEIKSSTIEVVAVSYPNWVQFESPSQQINTLHSNQQSKVGFSFSINKDAPVGTIGTLYFEIKEGENVLRTKEIRIESEAPKQFTLFQNYPNPFNPSTTLSWQLPQKMNLELSIFNTLGQRVYTKAFDQQPAGNHTFTWQAGVLASGAYFYELKGKSSNKNTFRKTGKMLLVK